MANVTKDLLDTALMPILSDLAAIKGAILGDGKALGLQVRVDRLEQARGQTSRLAWLIVGALLTIAAKFVHAAIQ